MPVVPSPEQGLEMGTVPLFFPHFQPLFRRHWTKLSEKLAGQVKPEAGC